MADWVKIGIKVALVGGVITAFVVILTGIQVPPVNSQLLATYINGAYSIAIHWCPVIEQLYTLSISVLLLNISVLVFRVGLFAFKTLMTIFE